VAALRAALPGQVRPHHRVLLREHLRVVETLQRRPPSWTPRSGRPSRHIAPLWEHLVTSPGVSTTAAQILVAEIGTDMTRFPSVGHLISWAGLCPRQDASAGKHRSTRLRKGAPWLKPLLIQGAWPAAAAATGICARNSCASSRAGGQ
jgi:transposase